MRWHSMNALKPRFRDHRHVDTDKKIGEDLTAFHVYDQAELSTFIDKEKIDIMDYHPSTSLLVSGYRSG